MVKLQALIAYPLRGKVQHFLENFIIAFTLSLPISICKIPLRERLRQKKNPKATELSFLGTKTVSELFPLKVSGL
jgi:hypothetical protein